MEERYSAQKVIDEVGEGGCRKDRRVSKYNDGSVWQEGIS